MKQKIFKTTLTRIKDKIVEIWNYYYFKNLSASIGKLMQIVEIMKSYMKTRCRSLELPVQIYNRQS
ncbi:hypothetical protein pb186bvf_012276 [Paramecium bursaria]